MLEKKMQKVSVDWKEVKSILLEFDLCKMDRELDDLEDSNPKESPSRKMLRTQPINIAQAASLDDIIQKLPIDYPFTDKDIADMEVWKEDLNQGLADAQQKI